MIVFNLVHDASHKAISKASWINKGICFLGDLVGINTYIWDIRHDIQHHTFTNVLGGDLIIESIPLIRPSPQQPYKTFHKYQVCYAPVFYMLYSFYWMFVIDFKLFFKKEICNLHNIRHPRGQWVILFSTKLFYLFYMLYCPWVFTAPNFSSVVGYFFIMHCAAGLLLSFVAVLGHFVEGPRSRNRKMGSSIKAGVNMNWKQPLILHQTQHGSTGSPAG
ncbi:MAG: fatty acid desaturase [Ferruginibacter sp.]|nr:fatty acid desaturase [Ferruginibacter sp.]